MFHGATPSDPVTDPTIPETGAALQVRLNDDEEDGVGRDEVIDAPPAVPVGPGGIGNKLAHGFLTYNFILGYLAPAVSTIVASSENF
jgi:hypothetical protein